jgi:signal transduction histidine kinase
MALQHKRRWRWGALLRWPRRLRWIAGMLTLLALAAALVSDAYTVDSPADYTQDVTGEYTVVRSARWLGAGGDGSGSALPPAAQVMQARGQDVALPHRLSKNLASASINWYRVPLELPRAAAGSVAYGVCVPRWSSSASVWLDGKQLMSSAPGMRGMHDWSRPQFIGLPPELAAGSHRLDIRLRALPALAPGLSEIWVGNGPLIRFACASLGETREKRIFGSGLLIGMMGLAGLLIAVLLRDASAGCFALMALLWVAQTVISRGTWIGLTEQTWSLLYFATRTAFVPPMFLFCLRFAKVSRPRLEQGLLAVYAGAVAILLALPQNYWATWLSVVAISLLLILPYALALLVRYALRETTISGGMLVAAVAFVMLSSVLDLVRWMGAGPYSSASLSILAMPLLSMAFGTLLIERLVWFARNEVKAAETLRVTVAHQAEQIAADFAVLQAQGERLVVLEERRRIARDMHDGVGSHLVSVSAMLKSGMAMPQTHVAGMIDSALHELRSVLDVLSAEPATHDDDDPVSTLLGSLRWRIAPVLESQGIDLEWEADSLPADFLPSDAARLQLLRLLQETFTNIVKHARARTVRFRSEHEGEAIVIEVSDDGCGLHGAALLVPAEGGLGLRGMRQRATLLGATLAIADCSPGTRVSLRFARPGAGLERQRCLQPEPVLVE